MEWRPKSVRLPHAVAAPHLGNRMQLHFHVSGKRLRQTKMKCLPTSLYLFMGFLELCWNDKNNDVTGDFPCGKRMRQPQKSDTARSSNAPAFDARVCRTHGIYIHLIWTKSVLQTHVATGHMKWQR